MGEPTRKLKRRSAGSPEQSQPDRFVLFLDETLHNCQPIHASLTKSGTTYIRHGEEFPPGTLDVEWLSMVGTKGWCVLTSDKRIRYNDLEFQMIVAHDVRAFIFTSGNLSGSMMGSVLDVAIPRMKRIFAETEPPFIACISRSGKVEVRFDRDGSIHGRKTIARKVDKA